MVFNSYTFAIFFPLFFFIYFLLINRLKFQNYFILASSFIFYSFWDYRFLSLLVFNTVIDYYFGLAIWREHDRRSKKALLIAAIVINLGILFFFKYFNFFIDSFESLSQTAGFSLGFTTLNIILPIGISFYTFHSLSYIIDVYYSKVKPTNDYVAYASFVSFFPQLVAGPISRAKDMLPKFLQKRTVDAERMTKGVSQMILGFFKKMVVADSIGLMVDRTFNDLHVMSDFQILLAVICYSFQIYCDFSGYSDIALGLGKILGIEFKINFNRPYFSRNFSEFWERWHISLSSWLRDYLYIPLGGNRKSKVFTYRNLMITMLLGGLWHGSSYNFIIWGALHGFFLVVQRQINFKLPAVLSILITFSLTTFAWIFFRSQSFSDSVFIIERILNMESFELLGLFTFIKIFYVIGLLLILDIFFFNYFENNSRLTFIVNIFLLLNILLFATFNSNAFIYFQF